MLTDINDVVGKYVFGFQDENCECTDVNNVLFVIDLKD